MEVYERIRFLRKNILKMTQTEFAEHLGVTRTVIKNIELNSLQTRSKIIAIQINL